KNSHDWARALWHESSDYYGRAQVAPRFSRVSKRLVNTEAQALNGARTQTAGSIARAVVIGFNQDAIHLHVAGSHFEPRGQAIEELSDDAVAVHSNHAAMWPGHADVRDVRRALRQNMFIGGSHMRVRSDNHAHAPIQIPAHGDFLAG